MTEIIEASMEASINYRTCAKFKTSGGNKRNYREAFFKGRNIPKIFG